ncbi:response regulator transcription factor [Rhodovarius crocodyli]|nr:response regulator transcription factor [Rhodovarius crocodyli]
MSAAQQQAPVALTGNDAPAAANDAAIGPVILVADDETELTDEICDYLSRYGLQPVPVNSFADCMKVLTTRSVDAIVLDQRFGPVDTLPLLPTLRGLTQAPILIHTGNREETDRVLGLELGADDFVLKPVSGRELVARLRARLRSAPPRPANMPAPAAVAPAPQPLVANTVPAAPLMAPSAPVMESTGWRVVPSERRVYRPDGSVVRLTTAEFDTLVALASKPGEVRSREDLTRMVFRRTWRPGDRSVDNAILHLRQKLAPDMGEGCIATVRQLGYVFTGFGNAA